MSVQTQNTNLNPYSNTPIKNLEYIQNKALVIAPFEITKSGKLDTDLMLDTPGFITMYLYKKIVAGEDKEPTADRFKTIKTMSNLVLSGLNNEVLISTFGIPVIFKYDKLTGTRIIEKDLSIISEVPEYIDLTIDISNGDFSSETGSGGFFCVCQVQKIQKPIATTAFNEVANDAFLFMIPSTECRELSEDTEFELLDSDNKVINIKRHGEPGEGVYTGDIYKDKVSLLLDGNDLTDKTGKTITNTGVTVDTSVKKYGSGSLKFNGSSYLTIPSSTDFAFGTGDFTVESFIYLTVNRGIIFDTITPGVAGLQTGRFIFYVDGQFLMTYTGTYQQSSTTIPMNQWVHVAASRELSLLKLFINGVVVYTGSNTSNLSVTNCNIGWDRSVNGTIKLSGNIDDLRISKGIARYTANFTPPNELSYVININEQEQGYRIHPVINISDHVNAEESFTPKYYLGSKYQRNLMEILSQGIKSKRTISNLKDMYLVDDLCIQTLKKINILLENNQMIKLTERLYNLAAPLREKLNADVILEYLSTPVSGSYNSDIAATLKTSLMEDYNFTQEEIDNLNDNLNTFKSRARIALTTPVVQGQGLDQLRFNLPKTFIDGNRSKIEKKNLLVFGTDAGFNKFNLAGYTTPYSNVSKRESSTVLDYNNLILDTPTLSSQNFKSVVDDKTFMSYSGSLTDATGKRPTLTGVSLSATTTKFNDSSIYINNSFISIPAGANLSIGTKDFTVETWINPSSISDVPIFTLGLNQLQLCFIVVLLSNGAVLFRAGVGSWGWDFASDRTTAANLVKANTWNHIVTQRRNGNLEIYVNGILSYTGIWSYNIPNGDYLYVGGYVGRSNITAYYDDISISNGVGRYVSNFTSKFTFKISDSFKDILTNYKQQIPFTYIPLSTDIANTNNEPVFENLTDITGFTNSDIVIDIPNVL